MTWLKKKRVQDEKVLEIMKNICQYYKEEHVEQKIQEFYQQKTNLTHDMD